MEEIKQKEASASEQPKKEKSQQDVDFLYEQIKSKDKRIDELLEMVKEKNEPTAIEQNESEITSIYEGLEFRPKESYTAEEAEAEFQNMIKIMREVKGTPTQELVGGTEPNDMGAAELLQRRGIIKTLEDFRRVRTEAAKYEAGIF